MLNDQALWKTLTSYQPWATMIALGHKPIETRMHDGFKWLKGHRLAIHAGKRYDPQALDCLLEAGFNAIHSLLLGSIVPRGAIVAVCRVAEARWLNPADDAAACCPAKGLYGLQLADVRALIEPIPARGTQGVWTWRPPEGWSLETHTRPV